MRELYRYRDLIATLVVRDLRVRYRRSVIGFLWTMLQPLLMMLVLYMVFSTLMRMAVVRFESRSYAIYALAGILFWNFFSQSIVSSMNSLRGNAPILKKLPVPYVIFPVTTVISGVVNLLFALVPMFAIILFTGHPVGPALLFLPISILLAALFTLGAGLLLSPLAVFFNDVIELVTVCLTLLFYLTPIFYDLSILEGRLAYQVIRFNPIRSILEVFRDPIFFGKVPPLTHLSVAVAITAGALLLGIAVFRRTSDRIPLHI